MSIAKVTLGYGVITEKVTLDSWLEVFPSWLGRKWIALRLVGVNNS
ncbi:MAG: hypothetical protein AB1589_44715 [Cyanobacteriota bacterium]